MTAAKSGSEPRTFPRNRRDRRTSPDASLIFSMISKALQMSPWPQLATSSRSVGESFFSLLSVSSDSSTRSSSSVSGSSVACSAFSSSGQNPRETE